LRSSHEIARANLSLNSSISEFGTRRGLDQCSFFRPSPLPSGRQGCVGSPLARGVVMRFQGNGFNEQMFGAE
jgi:hypothetical protein